MLTLHLYLNKKLVILFRPITTIAVNFVLSYQNLEQGSATCSLRAAFV